MKISHKAFKAWWNCRLEKGGKISAEEVWCEALQWVLNYCCVSLNGQTYNNELDGIIIRDRILKELEDE